VKPECVFCRFKFATEESVDQRGSAANVSVGGGNVISAPPSPNPMVSRATAGGVHGNNAEGSPNKVKEETALFFLFIFLAVTFLLCHGPRVGMNVVELYVNEQRRACEANYGRFGEPIWMRIVSSGEKVRNTFFFDPIAKA